MEMGCRAYSVKDGMYTCCVPCGRLIAILSIFQEHKPIVGNNGSVKLLAMSSMNRLNSWQRDFLFQNHVQTSSGNRYGTTVHKRPCFLIPQIHGIHSTCVNQLEHNADPNSYRAKVTNVSTMSTFMMWCLVHRLYPTCFTHETTALAPHSKLFIKGGS
jgi:hypothetical protein